MQIEVGKMLRDLNLKPGDVVECPGVGWYTVMPDLRVVHESGTILAGGLNAEGDEYRRVSRVSRSQPVTLSPTWEVMDPADAVHDPDRIPLPDGRVYARRAVVPVMGEVVLHGRNFGCSWGFGPTQFDGDTHRITLPTRDGALIAGTYTSADGHSVVVGVV